MNFKLLFFIILHYTSCLKEAKSFATSTNSTTSPSLLPSRKSPTLKPSKVPAYRLTSQPSMSSPTANPTQSPTLIPTVEMTFEPTFEVTNEPTPTSQLPPQNPPCLCMFASSCTQDSDCCPGLFCKINVGWTMCVEPAYNASLCTTSLYGYGCSTNADCCNPNATCEKEVCKLFCGSSPTRSPTTYKPTKKPSRYPTLFPTLVPTTLRPSQSPSMFISEVPTTLMPSERPTESPTVSPSDTPSESPTHPKPSRNPSRGKPSVEPTFKPPTAIPTYTVTLQVVPMIKFESFITFLNVSSGLSAELSFSSKSRTDITNDVDNILNLPSDSTTYIEDYVIVSSPGDTRRILSLENRNFSVNIVAHVLTAVSMSYFPPSVSVNDALSDLKSRLHASVFNGHFFGTLVYIAEEPDTWAGSSVANITFVNSDIVYPPSAAPTTAGYKTSIQGETKLGTTMIALIVSVVIVSVLFAAFLTFKIVRYVSSWKRNDPRLVIETAKTSDFAMVGSNFTEVRTENLMYEFDMTDLKDINPSAADIN